MSDQNISTFFFKDQFFLLISFQKKLLVFLKTKKLIIIIDVYSVSLKKIIDIVSKI